MENFKDNHALIIIACVNLLNIDTVFIMNYGMSLTKGQNILFLWNAATNLITSILFVVLFVDVRSKY